jgi:hypothetical protein
MTNWFHDINSDEVLDQSKTSMIQMTDLVDDDILYSGRGNKKDTHWSDDHRNIRIYNWCSLFHFFTDAVYKLYRVEYIATLNGSRWRVRPFAAGKEKWSCICRMFLMSYDDYSRARLIGMPYILENTSGTSTLIFPSPTLELILIEDTTLLKDHEYIHSGYMDRCTIA